MANIRDIGIPEISTGIAMPKRTNLWRVIFQGIAGGGESRSLSAQVIAFNAPSVRTEKIDLHRYNSKVAIAAKHSWEDVQMSVEDDIGGRASSILTAQHELQQRLLGAGPGPFLAVGRAGEDYKFAAKLDQMDGDRNVIESWIIEGCWINSMNFGERRYEQSEAVKIEVSLSIDHAYHVIYGPDGSAIGGVGSP
jgi:hypothetical protein